MKKIIFMILLIVLSSCRNSITYTEEIKDTPQETPENPNIPTEDPEIQYAIEIDEANTQNIEEALKRYAADHNGEYKLIFKGTSTKQYSTFYSIIQMIDKMSLKNIKFEVSLKNVIFPNNKLPDYLLGGNAINYSITKITMPDTITSIGEYAIVCSGLTSLELPSNLEIIKRRGLIGCESLKVLKLPNSLKIIEELALKGCGFESIEIPDSVTSIGQSAFGDCENLINVKLPNNLEIIPENMFESCGSLNTITIPASVKEIGKSVFYYSPNFESIRFLNDNPSSMTVGRSVFSGCPLKTVYIPASSTASDAEWRNTLGIDTTVNIVRE